MATKAEKFVKLFGVPEFATGHLHRFVTETDIDVVVALAGQPCTVPQAADRLKLTHERAHELLEDAYARQILNGEVKDGAAIYSQASFFEQVSDYQCMTEDYKDIDKEIREKLAKWCYGIFLEKRRPLAEKILKKEPFEYNIKKTYLFLADVDAFLLTADGIKVIPCNCRSLDGKCGKPVDTCLRFNKMAKERPFMGGSITREEAKEIILGAHRKGLMTNVNSDWRSKGAQWMCNCCSCCCWPHRLMTDLGAKGLSFEDRHVAKRNADLCTQCGACVKRCNFNAFYHDGTNMAVKGRKKKKVLFDPIRCVGCGICMSTCKQGAISMETTEGKA